ncbi:T9SS type A sorting domain-containing protein [Flavobacterium sp. DGU11]|uniref:T9SS type A sorting domain-containing protein n=1 Tax=Flavobacterium arundinis TaxID=3139143 RepID=A0ABU9HUU3_9FLAO
MKKIILMAGILLCGIAQAQITVTGRNEQVIQNGYEYVTNTLTPQIYTELPLHVTNTSDATLNLKLKVLSMQNTTGSGDNIQFCFGGFCYFSFTTGGTVPNSPVSGLELAPGDSNGDQDHFYLGNAGTNPGEDVVVNLAFVQVDNTGAQIGEPLVTFTYRYSPTAGTTDFAALQNMGISIKNTVVTNQLEFSATQNVKLELINMAGQVVKTENIKEGSQSADLSGLSAAVYFARFTNEDNKSSQIRIVKN